MSGRLRSGVLENVGLELGERSAAEPEMGLESAPGSWLAKRLPGWRLECAAEGHGRVPEGDSSNLSFSSERSIGGRKGEGALAGIGIR